MLSQNWTPSIRDLAACREFSSSFTQFYTSISVAYPARCLYIHGSTSLGICSHIASSFFTECCCCSESAAGHIMEYTSASLELVSTRLQFQQHQCQWLGLKVRARVDSVEPWRTLNVQRLGCMQRVWFLSYSVLQQHVFVAYPARCMNVLLWALLQRVDLVEPR